jgi:hypothetical protein
VLTVRRTGWWTVHYAIERDGEPVAAFSWSPSARTGRMEAPGAVVAVAASGRTGRRWVFALADGRAVARADGVGRARWDLRAADGAHRFEDLAWWRPGQQQHVVDGRPVGRVVRMSRLRLHPQVDADLPVLNPLLQLCAVAALAAVWDAAAA